MRTLCSLIRSPVRRGGSSSFTSRNCFCLSKFFRRSFSFFVSILLADFLFFWQVATYTKGLERRASLTEGSARVAKSYNAKVASLTSERAGLRA